MSAGGIDMKQKQEDKKRIEEELRRKKRQICLEEEEEEREIDVYRLRLEYMYEYCSECDQGIDRLLEEQKGILNDLGLRKKEFTDAILSRYLSWHI